MGISKMLKKFDIRVVDRVTKEKQIIIADNVATKISNRFNYIDYGYMYSKLMQTKMYMAVIPNGITRAIYSYEEDTLFISEEENIYDVSKDLLFECIHAMQDVRNKKGNLKQLGQCTFTDFKVYAMALNEASIGYVVSKVFGEENIYAEAYGIKAKTFNTKKYPLICNILLQLLFISDEETLVKSTINSTDDFIIENIEKLGEINYSNIQNGLDDMLYASEEIIGIKTKIKNKYQIKDEELNEELKKIYSKEEMIKKLYMNCQMVIFTKYFDRQFERLETLNDIKSYKNKMEYYKGLIGFYVDSKQKQFLEYFENYYTKKEEELILLEDEIKRRNDLALTVYDKNLIVNTFNKIKSAISSLLKKDENKGMK